MRSLAIRFALALGLLVTQTPLAFAQNQPVDIRRAIAMTIQQLQTGQLSQNWYSPQLWQTIASQTGNTGVYLQLRNLGAVTNVNIIQQVQLPLGPVYLLAVQHQYGVSNWLIGVNTMAGRLEYANFNLNQSLPPLPSAGPAPGSVPAPNPQPNPAQRSPACDKFPDLCG